MKRVKVIANNSSGKEWALSKVQQLVGLVSTEDRFELQILFTHKKGDALNYAKNNSGEDIIVCIGGDGTLNEVVNGIYQSKIDRPLAILPAGTVNDFANYLKLPHDTKSFYELLKREQKIKVDIGLAGEKAFINVAAGGLLSGVAHSVSDESKTVLGRFAYYIEGAREVIYSLGSEDKLIKLNVQSKEYTDELEALMFIIANSTSVGGFKNMAPHAEIQDGLLDVLFLRGVELNEAIDVLMKFYSGKHVEHEKIIYLKTNEITLSANSKLVVDIDGEKGDELPLTFKVLSNSLTLLI